MHQVEDALNALFSLTCGHRWLTLKPQIHLASLQKLVDELYHLQGIIFQDASGNGSTLL